MDEEIKLLKLEIKLLKLEFKHLKNVIQIFKNTNTELERKIETDTNNRNKIPDTTIFNESDLDGFTDCRVKTLAYYLATWYDDSKSDIIAKYRLCDMYYWLIKQKPSVELISQDIRCSSIMYYLDNFSAEDGDFIGAADLQDIKLELKMHENVSNLHDVISQAK